MRALCWHGTGDVRVDTVPDPEIEDPRDAIIQITSTAIRPLLEKITKGEIDPSFVVTHRAPLGQAPELYEAFRDKKDGCIKVVLNP